MQKASIVGTDSHGSALGSFAINYFASGTFPASGSITPQLHPCTPSSLGSESGPSWASRGSSGRDNAVTLPSNAVGGSGAPLSDDSGDDRMLSLHSGMSDLQGLSVEEPGISGLSMRPPPRISGGTMTHKANFLPWHRRPDT